MRSVRHPFKAAFALYWTNFCAGTKSSHVQCKQDGSVLLQKVIRCDVNTGAGKAEYPRQRENDKQRFALFVPATGLFFTSSLSCLKIQSIAVIVLCNSKLFLIIQYSQTHVAAK